MKAFWNMLIAALLLLTPGWSTADDHPAPVPAAAPEITHKLALPLVVNNHASFTTLSIQLGAANIERGITLDYGGDVDTEVVTIAGIPQTEARRTGNGKALPALDGNTVPDNYIQFNVSDVALFAGLPTTHLRIEVEYLDQGTDTFIIQYDGQTGGSFGDGRFLPTMRLTKTGTNQVRKAAFTLCDAYFANRDNDADFRIFDEGDGPETVHKVTVTLLPSAARIISVDEFGANPWDSLPDSTAIQAAADSACNGDTVLFTSGEGVLAYQGYHIDKTIFLLATSARQNLTYTSSNPLKRALLRASGDLRGYVVRLYAKSRIEHPGLIDDITISHLVLDGGRSERVCFGADGIDNGVGDNWGSWLPECQPGDPWCLAGGLGMDGAMDWSDPAQDYTLHPEWWSTGLLVEDVVSRQVECGSAMAFSGAAGMINNSVIDTAGDHVHAPGCPPTEADEGLGDWSDGITLTGPNHRITNNTIINPSDVGIVFFGGQDTIISKNTIQISAGYNGAFAGIAVHPWIFGNVGGVQVLGNTITNQGDLVCGGLHAGINLGTHMWGAGCVGYAHASTVGNAGTCVAEPAPPLGALCSEGNGCQEWAHIPAGAKLTLTDNIVSGAQINYLVEGLDTVGALAGSNNVSLTPRQTDWEAADYGCTHDGYTDYWDTLDFVAHHPSLPGWMDKRIHCER